MVDQAANMLLETLRDLLIEEVRFISGVSGKVKQMERDLRSIHGLLMEADKRRNNSQTLQDCIVELKDLATKAENVLENYAVEVESKRGKSLKKKLGRFIGILCECYSVHQAGNEVDDIRSRLSELTNKLSSVNGGEGSSNAAHEEQQRLLRLRYAHEIEQHFVGMEKDIESVLSMVSSLSPTVISICGMGGLGKTTLARKIYHHENVIGRFGGCRVWFCVTQQFEAKSVLREIFKQVDKNRAGIEGMESYELVRELHNVLEQKEWLIVIDDIWESPHWAILKPAFPMNCKVMLTTRNEKIDVASEQFRVHKLDFLSEDDGWELLRKIAFPINDDATASCSIVSKPIEDEGRLIVQRCGRLPLAISVIGGILRQKQQILAEWKNVRSNIESYLKNGEGIGSDIKGVKLVLDLSFDVLPYYLKSCFLYLACFTEDHEIDAEELYLLWMAEGLISSEEKGNSESLRDVAERYLTELAYRCMVQVEKGEYEYTRMKFTSCRLHDLMRDLCTSKAVEKKFLQRIEISKHQHDVPSIDRVAINLEDADDTVSKSGMLELEDLRSFLVLSKVHFAKKAINIENIVNLANSKHLKILVFRLLVLDKGKLPSAVSKLIHLRYLSLYGCIVEELPQHVCYFPYMNTLDLRVTIASIKLPNLIWKMKRLRHLFLNEIEVIGGDKLRLEGLNELETLVRIGSETTCIADVTNLTNLRRLTINIRDMNSLSKIVEYMSSNQFKLEETHLIIMSCDLSSGEEGRSIVQKMLKSHSLTNLDIFDCIIGWEFPCYEQGMCNNLVKFGIFNSKIWAVEELGKCPILQTLHVVEDHLDEEVMRFGANSFPELKFLILDRFSNIKKLEVEEGAMPKLRNLWMFQCSKLEKLPDALRFIPTLQELACTGVSSELKDRMRSGGEGGEKGEDYANFSHIPLVHIS